MSEVIWWARESWYEARSIPLFGFFVSPRQLMFVVGGGLLGLIASAAVPVYYGKVAAVALLVAAGAVLASAPARVVPWELALFYRWRRAGQPKGAGPKRASEQVPEVTAGSGVPLAVAGELRVEGPAEVVLLVDGSERARAAVSPDMPRYRLYYYPEEAERGAHDVEVVVNGETVSAIRVNVV